MLLIKIVLLLLAANGSPIVVQKLLGDYWRYPVDGHLRLADGYRLFGDSKTWRGVVVAVMTCILFACVLQLHWVFGLLIAVGAMLGDLLSSFIKRRLAYRSSARCSGVDQVPEALIPGLFLVVFFDVDIVIALCAALIFVAGDIILSPMLHKLGWRKVPY